VLTLLPYVKDPRGQARSRRSFVVPGPTAMADQRNGIDAMPQVAGRASLAASLHQGIDRHRKGPVPGPSPGSRLGETPTPTLGPPPGPAPPTPAIPRVWGNRTYPTPSPGGARSRICRHRTPHRRKLVLKMVEFCLTRRSLLTR
jgi:hypothetical protein